METKRINEIQHELVSSKIGIYLFRKIEHRRENDVSIRSYCISLLYDQRDFATRIIEVRKSLEKGLLENETIREGHKLISIEGAGYHFNFQIESFRKNADKIHYLKNGFPVTEFLHRPGIEFMVRHMRRDFGRDIMWIRNERMGEEEFVKNYVNPGDRFVAIGNSIKNEIKKSKERR